MPQAIQDGVEMRLHCPPASCSAPQVRVRLLDANLGRGRSGLAHRTFSTHDLWPSTPIRSPALRSPAKHNAGNCSTSSLLLSFTSPRFTGLCGFVKPAQITWHERNLHFCGCPVQRPRLAQQRGEPGAPSSRDACLTVTNSYQGTRRNTPARLAQRAGARSSYTRW
jgi:hypothetical protein